MRLEIRNFRAIQEQHVDLAPLTVVYGANGAGKSSLLYALLTLKNVVLNSNSAVSGFFNYSFASLGGFDAVVFDHQATSDIELSLTVESQGLIVRHGVSFGETKGIFKLSLRGQDEVGPLNLNVENPITFPYPGNQQIPVSMLYDEQNLALNWNGITAQVQAAQPSGTPKALELANRVAAIVNSPAEVLRKVSMVPLKRGFSKPFYQSQPLTPALITEEEVATFLSTDKYLVSKISFYLEKILERDFRVNVQPGTAIFSLDATDKKTGVATELVNEGFGVNQLVYFLAKALHKDAQWTGVEEPEIHLHPSAVRRFARALGEMVVNEKKRFLLSTHSEAFVTALLSLVAEGKVEAKQLAFYLVRKEGKKATFERQTVHDNGQIEGGLTTFMEGELEDLKSFLKVSG